MNLARNLTLFTTAMLSSTSVSAQQQLIDVSARATLLTNKIIALLPLLGIAIVVVMLFWLMARWVGRLEFVWSRVSENGFLQNVIKQFVQAAIVIVGLLLALDILEATALVGAVLGTAGVVGLAVGFAFRDVVENYLAGILLSLRQPFMPNDHIKVDGYEGKVIRLTSRATILLTFDGNHVRIPNATVFKSSMTNFSRNPLRRFNFAIGVATDQDLAQSQKIGLEVLQNMKSVLDDPEPSTTLGDPGDSTIPVNFYGWVDQNANSFGKAKSEAIRLINAALLEAGIDMPEPIYRVNVLGAKAPASKAAAAPSQKAQPTVAATAEQDTSVENELDLQIQKELAVDKTKNLLDESAVQE